MDPRVLLVGTNGKRIVINMTLLVTTPDIMEGTNIMDPRVLMGGVIMALTMDLRVLLVMDLRVLRNGKVGKPSMNPRVLGTRDILVGVVLLTVLLDMRIQVISTLNLWALAVQGKAMVQPL